MILIILTVHIVITIILDAKHNRIEIMPCCNAFRLQQGILMWFS